MKSLIILLTAIALLIPSSAFAEEVDIKKSNITWTASKVTGSTHTGQIFPTSSAVTLKAGKVIGGQVVFDMKTFTVTDLEGKWADKFLNHVKGSDFLNVELHPTATLKILSVKGEEASGELKLMGKTQKIVFPLKKKGNAWVGDAVFDRTKFGMIYGSNDFIKGLGDKAIANQVKVAFNIVIKS